MGLRVLRLAAGLASMVLFAACGADSASSSAPSTNGPTITSPALPLGQWSGTSTVTDPAVGNIPRAYGVSISFETRVAKSAGCAATGTIQSVSATQIVIAWGPNNTSGCGIETLSYVASGAAITGTGQLVAYSDGRRSSTSWQLSPGGNDPPPPTTLSVAMSGRGVVSHTTSLDGSASCTTLDPYPTPITCRRQFVAGTLVTLTAQAQAGYSFAGWSGEGCSGVGSCSVTMSQSRLVTASFAETVVAGTWSGTTTVTDPSSGNVPRTYSLTVDFTAKTAQSAGCGAVGTVQTVTATQVVIAWGPNSAAGCGIETVTYSTNGTTLTASGQIVAYFDGRRVPTAWSLTRR